MRESLRARLVLWYALVLTLVVVLYGGAVVYQSWRSMIAGVDAELDGYAREVSSALEPVDGGRFDLELSPDAAAYFFRRELGQPYYVIWNANGELVDQSDPQLHVTALPAGARSAKAGPGHTGSGRRELTMGARGGSTVLVGRDITDLQAEQQSLVVNVTLAGLITLALAVCGGWFVAGRALAPIKRISNAARAMSEGHLDARIAVERTESELEQVASTLNDAFDRLRLAVEQQRRFTADASHELRTPISVLRAETEWALDRDRTAQQYKDALAVSHRAALRMQDTVERLLALVRAEGRLDVQECAPVALRALIGDVAAWLAPMAQEKRVRLSVGGEDITVMGDVEQLREAVNNVVANAILYNRPDGHVTISTRVAGRMAQIEVVDTGIGISRDDVPRVFDRFFRVDKARSRDLGGSGLGLAIARTIVIAHGGDISCTSEPGVGSAFVMSLPTGSASTRTTRAPSTLAIDN